MPELVTPAEARRLYGIPPRRVYDWNRRGSVEACGLRGRAAVFPVDRLRELNRLANLDPRSVA